VVDSISLPRDTLRRTTGGCDDLTILFTSLLESVGIPTGYITIPDHIFPVFDTGIPVREYRTLHPSRDISIGIGETLWLPVEITMVGEGSFLEAWRKGCEEWNALEESPDKRRFIRTSDAQKIYRPVGLRETDLGLQYGNGDAVTSAFRRDFTALRDTVIEDYIQAIRDKGCKQDYYVLGVLYSRFGRFEEAEDSFNRALRIDKN